MEEWDKIWHLRMPGNFFLRCVHGNCWCCCHFPYMVGTIKVASFQQYVERHFLTFVQSMTSNDIGVHNNQTLPDLRFLSWSKFDTFNPRETWLSKQGSGVNTLPCDRLEPFLQKYGLVLVLAKGFRQSLSGNCKNNLVLKSASYSHSSIALLGAIGLLVPLFWVLTEKCVGYIGCQLWNNGHICGVHRRSSSVLPGLYRHGWSDAWTVSNKH